MAAVGIAIRAALARLGFSDEAATSIQVDQGLSTLDEFELLSDSDVSDLCKVVRRPGGTVAAVGAPGGQVANPGISVSMRAETNLKLACYFLRYGTRTSRVTVPADITLDNVRALKEYRDWEKAHDDVDPHELKRDWPRNMENLEEYLRGCLGSISRIPLAYVVRENLEAQLVAPAGGYASRQDELVARAPIVDANGEFLPTYLQDRAEVWEKIAAITRESDCWTYVRPAQRTRDGRMAFQNLDGHYLGVNNVDNMSTLAESKLTSTIYDGEKRRWNFEKYVKVHVDQHAILEGLVEHGYSGIDQRSKVRYLMNGIRTRELDPVKTRILSDATLRNDFDACVNLYKDYITQNPSLNKIPRVQIAAVHQSDDGDDGNEADMSVEDRYYNTAEYRQLTTAQKLGLKLKRKKRGSGGAGGRKRKAERGRGKPAKLSIDKRSIKALAAALKAGDEETAESDSDGEEPPSKKAKSGSNRHNKNLIRNKTRSD